MMDLDEIQLGAEEAMEKALDYLKSELRGVRSGRASTGLVEHLKVDYYGSQTDLRQLAMISVPESTQLLIKPFDASSVAQISKSIQSAGLGLNPVAEGKQLRINLPPLSGERRQQVMGVVKQNGEQCKVTIRSARRDANKHLDQVSKDKAHPISEDEVDRAKQEVQGLLKRYERRVDELVEAKTKEVQEI